MGAPDPLAAHLLYCKRKGLRPRSIDARRTTLERLVRHSGHPLMDVTREDVEAFIDAVPAVASKRVYLAHCRSFYNWAVDEEILVHSPCRKVMAPPLKRNLPRPMSERDLGVALATADPLIHAWILVAAFTGLRACEVALMRGEHVVHGDNPYLLVPEGKGGKSRTVPLPPVVMDELRNWPSYGWMWKADGPFHYQVVSRKVGAHLRAQGIRAGMHTIRHRFGTQSYIASGRDLRMTQELMGHSSPSTTAIYTALDPREGSTVVGRLPLPAA